MIWFIKNVNVYYMKLHWIVWRHMKLKSEINMKWENEILMYKNSSTINHSLNAVAQLKRSFETVSDQWLQMLWAKTFIWWKLINQLTHFEAFPTLILKQNIAEGFCTLYEYVFHLSKQNIFAMSHFYRIFVVEGKK